MAKTNSSLEQSSLYDKLILSYKPYCCLADRKELSIKEKQAVYKLKLSQIAPTAVFSIDGVIIKEGLRCDKLVLVQFETKSNLWNNVFVELKGTAIRHAIKQLRETIKNSLFYHQSNKNIYARVVGSSFPSNKSDPTIEMAKREFRRAYKCDLKMIRSGQPERMIV